MQDSKPFPVVPHSTRLTGGQSVPGQTQLRLATILVVDDDEDVRRFTADCLRDNGYIVIEADGPAKALELISAGMLFDLALLDFAMPGMNGKELAGRIASARHHARVLFLTGFSGAQELRDIAPERIIQKPYDMDDLTERVDAELHGHQSRNS